jgi:hypothetical protein
VTALPQIEEAVELQILKAPGRRERCVAVVDDLDQVAFATVMVPPSFTDPPPVQDSSSGAATPGRVSHTRRKRSSPVRASTSTSQPRQIQRDPRLDLLRGLLVEQPADLLDQPRSADQFQLTSDLNPHA